MAGEARYESLNVTLYGEYESTALRDYLKSKFRLDGEDVDQIRKNGFDPGRSCRLIFEKLEHHPQTQWRFVLVRWF